MDISNLTSAHFKKVIVLLDKKESLQQQISDLEQQISDLLEGVGGGRLHGGRGLGRRGLSGLVGLSRRRSLGGRDRLRAAFRRRLLGVAGRRLVFVDDEHLAPVEETSHGKGAVEGADDK